jgi:hypothetical protein
MNAAAVLFPTSNAATLPAVPTVTCARCGARWNAKSLTVQEGRCGDCWAPFVTAPAAPDYTTRCATCGVEVCRHFDGWDGSPLGCEETCRRWGRPAPTVGVDWELMEHEAVEPAARR